MQCVSLNRTCRVNSFASSHQTCATCSSARRRSVCVSAAQNSSAGIAAANTDDPEACLSRRATMIIASAITAVLVLPSKSEAVTSNPLAFKKELKARRRKIPESEYTDGPQGLKYYDLQVGGGATADVGERVACHFDVKFRNVTMFTSRQGMGVTGGEPVGWDVGAASGAAGSTLPGIDLGVRGMRVGGLRKLIVPPDLGYGPRGVGEIPGDATLDITVELLSIKTNPFRGNKRSEG